MNSKKQKKLMRIVALVLVGLMVFGLVVSTVIELSGLFDGPAYHDHEHDHGEVSAAYDLNMYYHESSQAVEVSQRLTYTNETEQTLSCVQFHLYENAYRRLTTAPFFDADLADAYPEGFAPGGVDFVSVSVDGRQAHWGVYGEGEEFLRVECDLAPGETCEFGFDYYVLLPVTRGRSGVSGLDVRLGYFYPVAAVYDPLTGDFELETLYPQGDSLYSECARYDVTINVPETYEVAGTGEKQEQPLEGRRKQVSFHADSARDFALVMSRRYRVYGDEQVQVYAVDGAGAKAALGYARGALAAYEEWFGACPQLDIVQADILADGYSYPGVILIREDLFAADKRDELEYEVVRQVAHQYFSGMVGSNPVDNPFLDDSICEYAALLYYERVYGEREYLERLNQLCLPALQITLPGALTVDAGLYLFQTETEYDAVIRARGCAVLHEMRTLMGADALLTGLQLYVQRFGGQNAALADFPQALNDATGKRWDELLIGQMHSIGDYARQEMERYE